MYIEAFIMLQRLKKYLFLLVSFLVCFILGTAAVGHTDKIGRLKELCEQYGIWLHVKG